MMRIEKERENIPFVLCCLHPVGGVNTSIHVTETFLSKFQMLTKYPYQMVIMERNMHISVTLYVYKKHLHWAKTNNGGT